MCVFCKIANGEIPSYRIYEDEQFLAFLDISQSTIGHTLVIPKHHYENIFDLDEATAGQLFRLTVRLAGKIGKALSIQSMNILNNNGSNAGQTVPHFHIHLIPRYPNDEMVIRFSQNKLTDEEFRALCDRIVK